MHASYQQLIFFISGSECRNQYMKISSWPILMAYQRNGFGVQYQKSIWTEEALTKFINSLLQGNVERLTTPSDLLAMMSKHEALVVGFVDMESDNRNYRSFHRAALKFLEKDNFKEVGFAVVTGETALAFGVDNTPVIRAYMWNETLQYYGNDSWTSRNIVKWITENLHQVSANLSPPGTKSFSLAPFLSQGPLLLLSTPRNLNWDSDMDVMLKQIGMEYYNCGGDNWVQEMARDYLSEKRMKNREEYKTLKEECEMTFPSQRLNNAEGRCTASVSGSASTVLNTSKGLAEFCEATKKTESCGFPQKSAFSYQKSSKKALRTSMLDDSDSDATPEAILKYDFQEKCEMLKFAEKKQEILFINEEYEDVVSHLQLISGLACKANRTISFLSVDSELFPFAERLGVDIRNLENQTAAVIIVDVSCQFNIF